MFYIRFGSMFRNSIPPPRPYSPPSFDDIFGGEETRSRRHQTDGGKDGEKEKDGNYVNLRLFNKVGSPRKISDEICHLKNVHFVILILINLSHFLS